MDTPIPYSTQSIDQSDIDAVCQALTSGWLTQGPLISQFEEAFAKLHQVKHAVSVCNATAGLHIACLALGVGSGQRVWTSPNSFVASANCALYCGAQVDFVDIDPITRNMSVEALSKKLELARIHHLLPSVVIPVHFAGLPCDLAPMRLLADQYGFKILEDASHAVGASYNGQPIGSEYADASVFSFHPVKIVTTGEGGLVTTHDDEVSRRLKLLRSHGITRDKSEFQSTGDDLGAWHYEQHSLGFNYRLTDIQAALGLSQLQRIDQFQAHRERLASRYDQLLAHLPLQRPSRIAGKGSTARSSWHLYVIEIQKSPDLADRATVFSRMRAAGIGVNVHYTAIHLQPYYKSLGFKDGQYPCAEAYARHAISIPLYPQLTDQQQDRVVHQLASALKK
jgi:UDP-4-amino-4,6-dideoxy-N-acetyl-beta-L-altrosamine transaminase